MLQFSRRTILQGCGVAMALRPSLASATPRETLSVAPIADGIFVAQGRHELSSSANAGHIANLSFVVGDDAIAVIDTGGSARNGEALLAAIRKVSDRPIRYVINTHMHPDHLFGNAPFQAPETIFVGHAKLPMALAARAGRYLATNRTELGPDAIEGTRVIAPTELVATTKILDIGGRTLTLTARKTAHTDNDLTVGDDKTGTLFLGDLLFSGRIPTIDGSIKGWLQVLAELRQEPAARVVPGHGPVSMGWPEGMAAEQHYLETVTTEVRALIKAGKTLEDAVATAARGEKQAWLLFDEFHPRNVSAAFAELEWE